MTIVTGANGSPQNGSSGPTGTLLPGAGKSGRSAPSAAIVSPAACCVGAFSGESSTGGGAGGGAGAQAASKTDKTKRKRRTSFCGATVYQPPEAAMIHDAGARGH